MARQPDASKQQRWLDLMRRWQQSRLTVSAFCARNGLSQASFYFWRRVLRERGVLNAPRSQPAVPALPPAAFVKLTVDTAAPVTTAVEVVLSADRLLRIRPGFDPDTVRQLVRLLEELPC